MTEIITPSNRRRVLLAVAAVLAVAAAITVGLLSNSPHHRHIRAVAELPVVTDPPTPTPVPTSAAPRPVVPHDFVAPAVPTAFKLSGRGFTIRAHVCAMPPVFPLDPPGDQRHTVCWVTKGFGVRPGSKTATSYVLGHSWAEDPLEVLNKASERATRDILREKPTALDGVPVYPAKSLLGARITLRTASGTLVYAVRNAFGVDKMKLGNIRSIMDPHVPSRVVLITCAERRGVDYDYNVVLDARLTSSRSTGKS